MPKDTKKIEREIRSQPWIVVRIQDEMDKLLKIFSHMRQCIENEMDYTKTMLSQKTVDQAGALAQMMDKVVTAKIKFEKSAREMAESMTPEEEREACTKYIQSMEPDVRKQWLNNLLDWMERRAEVMHGRKNTHQVVFTEGPVASNELVSKELAE